MSLFEKETNNIRLYIYVYIYIYTYVYIYIFQTQSNTFLLVYFLCADVQGQWVPSDGFDQRSNLGVYP